MTGMCKMLPHTMAGKAPLIQIRRTLPSHACEAEEIVHKHFGKPVTNLLHTWGAFNLCLHTIASLQSLSNAVQLMLASPATISG